MMLKAVLGPVRTLTFAAVRSVLTVKRATVGTGVSVGAGVSVAAGACCCAAAGAACCVVAPPPDPCAAIAPSGVDVNVGTTATIARVGVDVASAPEKSPQPATNSAPAHSASTRKTDLLKLTWRTGGVNVDFIRIGTKLSLQSEHSAIL
ncbi:MAG: hypothetical protein OXF86_23095, partial [Caldilineaceae bacterium]|nr:hypothetical protein [Caldilineaceae bacterium]